jgi:CRISPR-associated Cas5-like protein
VKPYPLQLEISGPTALWARPDTMPNPVSYVAPTFSAAKGIFEAILRWKSVNVRPTRCEVCAPVQFHRYAFHRRLERGRFPSPIGWERVPLAGEGGGLSWKELVPDYPDSESGFRDGTAPCATENHVIPAFLETVFNQPQNGMNRN